VQAESTPAHSSAGATIAARVATRSLRPVSEERVDYLHGDIRRIKGGCRKYDRVRQLYECHDHQHAVAILVNDYPDLFAEICDVLISFQFTDDMVKKAGGSKSDIPKTFEAVLQPLGWKERCLTAELVVDDETVSSDTHKMTS